VKENIGTVERFAGRVIIIAALAIIILVLLIRFAVVELYK
jgi:hypothetical protein